MSWILTIDTAMDKGTVVLSKQDNPVSYRINENNKDDGGWPHQSIKDMAREQGISLNDVAAVGVTLGPGSYTGLRVGLSTAKGLSYALRVPLIGIKNHEVLAHAVHAVSREYVCPMIDARRMEVYYALYNPGLDEIIAPSAAIPDPSFLNEHLDQYPVIFCGNGAAKLRSTIQHPNAVFNDITTSPKHLSELSWKYFQHSYFCNLAYTEPLYVKEFHDSRKKA